MRRLVLLLVGALILAGAWLWNESRAGAVSGRAIKLGRSASSSLSDTDPRLRSRGPYQLWRLKGRRGQRITIDMTSSSFDAFLILRGPDGYVIGVDDDGGGNNNARVRTILPHPGTYTIVAAAYGPEMRGDYTLTIGDWVIPDAPEAGKPQTLAMGETKDGLLEPGDELTGDGPYQDRWSFDLAKGAQFRLEMRSTDLDSYLMLLGPTGATIATNDDGSGRDAIITMRAPAEGRYTVLATTFGDQPFVGAYRISLTEVTGEIGGAPVPIALGEAKDGTLDSGDSTASNGSYADTFLFRAPATRSYQVDMTSSTSQMDPYLTLQDSLGNLLATDDDGGDQGLDARLVHVMQQGQLYRIVAGTFGSGRHGPYRVSVNPAP